MVPETTSFKVLYTGLLKGKLWLTAIVVVAPVAMFILLFIAFFDFQLLKKIFYRLPNTDYRLPVTSGRTPCTADPPPQTANHSADNSGFILICLTLFIYYIIATVFYGQYQERYRIPVIVVFIVPLLSIFILSYKKVSYTNKLSVIFKSIIIGLFIFVWAFQLKSTLNNKTRIENALKTISCNSNPIIWKNGLSDYWLTLLFWNMK